MYTVAIVGSRTFADLGLVQRIIQRLLERHGSSLRIVSGGAMGADRIAASTARAREIPVIEHLADWERLGRSAGFARNRDIVADADEVIVLFAAGPRSRGSQHSLSLALDARKPVHVYHEGRWTKS